MYDAGATRNEKAGNVALGVKLKSVVNYVINLNFDGEVEPSALMYEVKTKKSSDAKHGLEKEALNTWQR
jgi:hypothetical protein